MQTPVKQAEALLDLADVAATDGDHAKAMAYLEEAYGSAVAARDSASAASALLQLAIQSRLRGNFTASLAYSKKIFELDDGPPGPDAFKGYLALGHHYASLGQDATVASLMLEAESHLSKASISDICRYFELRATAAARLGDSAESVRAFDTLIDLSARHDSPMNQAIRLCSAAASAGSLGQMARAFSLLERALEIARSDPSARTSALPALSFAWTCLTAGDVANARRLFDEAETRSSKHLHARLLHASVGLILGCLQDDKDLAERCLDLEALEIVLAEANAYRAGPIAGAIHQYYLHVGQLDAATALRERFMRRISTPHGCWWMLLQVAIAGSADDATRAIAILEPYVAFPIARAHKLATEARLAALNGSPAAQASLARGAASIFKQLGWRHHEHACIRAAGRVVTARKRAYERALSSREIELAKLVAKGLSNRQIADRLQMAERTVKYHLTLIFDALGVHQRSELADLLNSDPAVLTNSVNAGRTQR